MIDKMKFFLICCSLSISVLGVNDQPKKQTSIEAAIIAFMNDPEIVKWLTGVKNSAPDFIFQGLLKLAEKELSLKRWMNVKDALTEGAMVA